MRFILIDVLAFFVTGGLVLVGWSYVKTKRASTLKGHLEAMRLKGKRNAEQLVVDSELICIGCGEACEPEVDLHIPAGWCHRRCYDHLI